MQNRIDKVIPLVLTFNDEKMIERLLDDLSVFKKVLIVDSFSSDNTENIVKKKGRDFVKHEFVNQAKQVNWAVKKFYKDDDWVLRLDSDERVSKDLIDEINYIVNINSDFVGYIDRKMYWMGKKLRFSALKKHFIGRLYQPKNAFYEEVTEEHLVHTCKSIFFKNKFYEENLKNDITYFIDKHIDTAKGEVREYISNTKSSNSLFSIHAHERRKFLKLNFYNKNPIFFRAFVYFIYRYIFKLGFLDGKAGFSFCFFQAFFYRMLIDQLIFEKNKVNYD